VKEILPSLVQKNIGGPCATYLKWMSFNHLHLSTFTFDLRMLKGVHDVFNIVVSNNWEPKHVYNELFEAIDTFGVAMVARL
jgi:hypothetical protein